MRRAVSVFALILGAMPIGGAAAPGARNGERADGELAGLVAGRAANRVRGRATEPLVDARRRTRRSQDARYIGRGRRARLVAGGRPDRVRPRIAALRHGYDRTRVAGADEGPDR